MDKDLGPVTTVEKEMGITHRDFYKELPNLLDGIPYRQDDDTIKFQINNRTIEITLGPERVRELGLSIRLPVTPVALRFFEFPEEEISEFIKHFNLKFMKGGG
jgi:hypothetical protein